MNETEKKEKRRAVESKQYESLFLVSSVHAQYKDASLFLKDNLKFNGNRNREIKIATAVLRSPKLKSD